MKVSFTDSLPSPASPPSPSTVTLKGTYMIYHMLHMLWHYAELWDNHTQASVKLSAMTGKLCYDEAICNMLMLANSAKHLWAASWGVLPSVLV